VVEKAIFIKKVIKRKRKAHQSHEKKTKKPDARRKLAQIKWRGLKKGML